jgi:PadR family transcriptional regulator PadR
MFIDPAQNPSTFLLLSQRKCGTLPVGNQKGKSMKQKSDVLQGTLGLMTLKTLDVLGPLHGYGIARRIEQISGDLLAVNQGTLYPVLLKLEQEGAIAYEWGASENNRRARF